MGKDKNRKIKVNKIMKSGRQIGKETIDRRRSHDC